MEFGNDFMPYQRRDFSEYTLPVLNETLGQLADAVSCPVTMTAHFSNVRPDTCLVKFVSPLEVQFKVSPAFKSQERCNFFTNRWLCTWPLFAAAKLQHNDLAGQCLLWLDDLPSGPGLAFCGNATSHVLVPDPVFMEFAGYAAARNNLQRHWVPWSSRADKVFWRGASTGFRELNRAKTWQELPRFRLCLLVKDLARDDLFDVAISKLVQIRDQRERAEIGERGIVHDEVAPATFMNYKYSIDIDGNTSSWPGLFTKLMMGITVLKVDLITGYRQWYYDRLLPWKNFVPISSDMAELLQVAEWLRAHPLEAERIAAAGHELADLLTMPRVIDQMAGTIRDYVLHSPADDADRRVSAASMDSVSREGDGMTAGLVTRNMR